MNAPVNPFLTAEKVSKKVKLLIYGLPGTGKTLAALTFPRPAVIDSEGGTDLYAGRPGVPAFSVLRAKSMDELNAAVAFIQADKGKTFDTLIIDPITVFYDVQKEAAAKTSKDGEMNVRLWGKVNGRMVSLYNVLTNLPVHVVVIARESVLYTGEGLNLKASGYKADADKKIEYMFDFVIRMRKDHSAEVIKSRGVGLDKEIANVNWGVFAKAAGMFTDGQTLVVKDEDKAAEVDARAYEDAPAKPASAAPQKSAPPEWWGVLAEYKPFMEPESFDAMRDEMSAGAKNNTLKITNIERAREYIEKLWDTAIDFDAKRNAEKDADELPA